MADPDRPLLRHFIEHEILAPDQINKAVAKRDHDRVTLRRAILDLGLLTDADFQRHAAQAFGTEYVDLVNAPPTDEVLRHLAYDICSQHRVVPVAVDGSVLVVAACEPVTSVLVDDLRFVAAAEIRVVYAPEAHIDAVLGRMSGGVPEPDVEESPVVRIVGEMLAAAATAHASAVHIDPDGDGVLIRFRIDGRLVDHKRLPPPMRRPLAARIKIVANLDIAERRLPQMGRFGLDDPVTEFLVSTLPTAQGEERIVLRLRHPAEATRGLGDLGFPEPIVQRLTTVIHRRRGLLIVAGPGQSGVTTTIHALAFEAARAGLDVLTVEEFFERRIPGVTHTQVNGAIGYTLARGVRAAMNQDADAILVSSLHGAETAEAVFAAVARGRLVLAGLHVRSAPGAIRRLLDMGIDPWLISDSIVAVLAQRLVRKPDGGLAAIGDLLPGPIDLKNLPAPGLRKAALDAVSAGLTTMAEALTATEEGE